MRKTSLSLVLIIGGPVLFVTLFLTARLHAFSATKPTTTPAAGFTWSMRERFGLKDANGLVNYHWNSEKETYEDSYVHPPIWTVDFDGCAGAPPQSAFRWEVDGQLLTETKCAFSQDFPSLKSHVVRLTVTAPDGQSSSTETNVFLRDLFIVSVGDSFASGEGNPDVPRN